MSTTEGRHLDRLTAVDASFLTNEKSNAHMHVGAILIFEGPPPHYTDLVEHVRGRLHLVPRFRQKLVVPPLETGPAALGRRRQLQPQLPHPPHRAARAGRRGAAETARRARLLAAARPLQAALGDVAGAGPRARPLRDPDQDPPRDGRRHLRRRHRHRALRPRAGAGADGGRRRLGAAAARRGRRSWSAAGSATRSGCRSRLAENAVEAVRHPESAARKAVEALEAVSARSLSQFADPAPDVPLNQPIGPHRRYVWARSELATFKRIKDALGGTVNDVVLAAVTGSIRNWLHGARRADRGARAAGAGPGLDPHRGRARQPRQPDRADAGAAAGLRRGPGAAPPHDQRRDGRPEATPNRRWGRK